MRKSIGECRLAGSPAAVDTDQPHCARLGAQLGCKVGEPPQCTVHTVSLSEPELSVGFRTMSVEVMKLSDRQATLCGVDGCARQVYARALCEAHYRRRQRTGSTT